MKKIYIALIFVILSGVTLLSQTVEIEVRTTIDNTIFKGLPLSNGVGEYLFTGTTDKDVKKRALVMFDLSAAVPEGVSIDSAIIVMVPSKVKPGSTTVTVFRLTLNGEKGPRKQKMGMEKELLLPRMMPPGTRPNSTLYPGSNPEAILILNPVQQIPLA